MPATGAAPLLPGYLLLSGAMAQALAARPCPATTRKPLQLPVSDHAISLHMYKEAKMVIAI